MTIPVQVDGRLLGAVELEPDASEDEARTAAIAIPRIATYLKSRVLKNVIYRPGRIVGIITGPATPPN